VSPLLLALLLALVLAPVLEQSLAVEPAGLAWEPPIDRARWWQESALALCLGNVAAQHSPTAPVMMQSRRPK
jgi:hypothetical protein